VTSWIVLIDQQILDPRNHNKPDPKKQTGH